MSVKTIEQAEFWIKVMKTEKPEHPTEEFTATMNFWGQGVALEDWTATGSTVEAAIGHLRRMYEGTEFDEADVLEGRELLEVC